MIRRASRAMASHSSRPCSEAGLPACAKHFPGHGEASVDSHEDLPVVDLPPDRFEHVEWVPFRAAIDAGVDAVMSCHLLVPSLDEHAPATLSPHDHHERRRAAARVPGGWSSPTTWT